MNAIANPAKREQILEKSRFASLFSFDVLPYVSVAQYDKNEYIIQSDEPLKRLCYLVGGTAKLYVFHKNGKQTLVNFFTPPCILGESELFDDTKQPFPLQALTLCTVIEVDTRRCKPLLLSDATFLRNLCIMTAKKSVAQNKKYTNLVSYPSENNFASYLLLTQCDGIFCERYTETADYLGISYRHLMFLISNMCASGILERIPGGLRIKNFEQIQKLTNEMNSTEFDYTT
ncbi:MAG: transcriptional regulator YeiL [Clostridiales bacterium]|nr:transcriptional regulator YeiL [Clostridiales bacterium]